MLDLRAYERLRKFALLRQAAHFDCHVLTAKNLAKQKINLGIKFFRKGLYSDKEKNDEKERFDYCN